MVEKGKGKEKQKNPMETVEEQESLAGTAEKQKPPMGTAEKQKSLAGTGEKQEIAKETEISPKSAFRSPLGVDR